MKAQSSLHLIKYILILAREMEPKCAHIARRGKSMKTNGFPLFPDLLVKSHQHLRTLYCGEEGVPATTLREISVLRRWDHNRLDHGPTT